MAPLITPDFSEALEFTALTPGTYKARIVGCETKQTQAGNTRLLWKLETFGSEKTENNNRTLWHSTPVSGKGAGILKSFVTAATGETPTGPFDTDKILGREIKVTVVDGKDYKTGEPTGYAEVKAVAKLAG